MSCSAPPPEPAPPPPPPEKPEQTWDGEHQGNRDVMSFQPLSWGPILENYTVENKLKARRQVVVLFCKMVWEVCWFVGLLVCWIRTLHKYHFLNNNSLLPNTSNSEFGLFRQTIKGLKQYKTDST